MFSDPQLILSQVSIPQNAVVCDLGAGSGFYSLALSSIVGDRGKVYAVDIQKEVLNRLANQARAAGRTNVEVVWGDAEKLGGTKIKNGLIDMVIVSNILFLVEQKDIFVNEISRILKPRGSVVFVDWSGSFGDMGPRPEKVVTEDQAKKLFESKGFTVEKSINTGAHHYGMIFRKA